MSELELECPFWWDRGDRVFYQCRFDLAHDGPHEPVHAPPGFRTNPDAWQPRDELDDE